MMPDPSLAELARQLGPPRQVAITQEASAPFDPIWKTDRHGEVALVLLRPDRTVWLMRKLVYPPGAYRIPTGGVHLNETVAQALARELTEETSWRLPPERFLASIDYRFTFPDGTTASFFTHAFLFRCGLDEPRALDPDELVAGFRRVSLPELNTVADQLASLPDEDTLGFGSLRDWGRFRAVVHRVVAAALREQP